MQYTKHSSWAIIKCLGLLLALAGMLAGCGKSAPAQQREVMVNLKTVQSGPKIQATELEGAIARQPRNASLYARRAAFRLEAGLVPAALQDINRALELDDSPAEFYFTKARALRAQGQLKSALEAAEEASRRGFTSPDLNLLVGETHLAERRYQDALDQMDRALQQEPDHAAALFYKGVAYIGLQDTLQALDYLRASLSRDPRQPETLHQLAFISNAFRQPANAARYAARGLKLAPTYGPLWYDYGRQFELQNQPDSAVRVYAHTVQLDTTFYRADYRLALVAYKNHKYAEAIPHLQRALRRAPRLAGGRQMLAESYESLARYPEAADQYRQLVAENPGNRHWSYKAWKIGNRAKGIIVDETPRRAVEPIEPISAQRPLGL
ncbi:Tetratricopeptide repeat-containing protein [Hymenobacter gelipurpurascens]|uniref:Tetratricopeptide repeat-containing protein n=1 Tax=Hymenobacter gelipurpurascens TaxID=89968 RepID=A0A212TBB6_9BACT|nr:tetratricopeptide repeat protein [Hymenobacter gelipurpurascens]SNC63347.1 Tetratricopeptide repeat-containing protein [Hymenobacter gelipurpurascens]